MTRAPSNADLGDPDRAMPERWRTALVYGLGASGRAASRLLIDRGVAVVALDDRELPVGALSDLELEPAFRLLAGADSGHLPANIDAVVVSPGVALDRPLLIAARAAGLPIVGEIELAFSFLDGEVVAITGSNGKSTTTALAGALIAAAGRAVEVCGNFGPPLSSRVAGPAGRVFVVEISSFQLETVERFRPRVAALLNVSPDHLDRHRDLLTYREVKTRIFARQLEGDVAVLNADDPLVARTELPRGVRRRTFSRLGAVEDGCFVEAGRVYETGSFGRREMFAADDLSIPGPHNLENAMAAALVASSLDAAGESMPPALRAFSGLPHRMVQARVRSGVAWYNDSKGTNVAATERSLESFADGSVHLILGGRNKQADPAYLRPIVKKKARAVYLIGEAAPAFESALRSVARCVSAGTLERAVDLAAAAAHSGEVVLLSPACASFDQFRDFVDRGETFERLVSSLPEPTGGDLDG